MIQRKITNQEEESLLLNKKVDNFKKEQNTVKQIIL